MTRSASSKNLLYRYLAPSEFRKRIGFDHHDPLIDEFTYGEGGRYADFVSGNVGIGSHIFFHTTIDKQRYITACYVVSDIQKGAQARRDSRIINSYKNPHVLSRFHGDIIVFGDLDKSIDIRNNPLPFDRKLSQKLEFEGVKRIRFDVKDKNGKLRSDSECITSATRRPRVLTDKAVNFLIDEIRKHRSVGPLSSSTAN